MEVRMGLQEWQVRPLEETRQVQAGPLWGGAEAGVASARCQVVTLAGPRPVGRGERLLLPAGLPAPLWDSASPRGEGAGKLPQQVREPTDEQLGADSPWGPQVCCWALRPGWGQGCLRGGRGGSTPPPAGGAQVGILLPQGLCR